MAQHSHLSAEEAKKQKIKQLITVALILAGITAVEFVLAFTMPANIARVIIFIILTLAKAFYIVAEFMHLKYEFKVLIWAVVLPIAFIIWFIVALLSEGTWFINTGSAY